MSNANSLYIAKYTDRYYIASESESRLSSAISNLADEKSESWSKPGSVEIQKIDHAELSRIQKGFEVEVELLD